MSKEPHSPTHTPKHPITAEEAFEQLRLAHQQKSSHAPIQAARHCTACIVALMAEDRQKLVEESAAFLEQLFLIWKNTGIDQNKIWAELKKREMLGALLVTLNKKIPAKKIPHQLKTPSTKLP